MKKTTIRKIALSSLLAAFTVVVGASVATLKAEAEVTAITVSEATITMKSGASARISSDGFNGLRYTMETSKTDYEGLKKTYGNDISFGIIIAPAEYEGTYGDINADTVFGAGAVYDWATYENGEWVYEGTKTRVINLSSTVMAAEENNAENYVLYGTISNLDESNYAREFVGVGYVSYLEGETVKYKFLNENDNARSMAYVAQVYQTLDTISVEDKAYVLSTYVTGKADQKTTYYTVRHMLSDGNGNYVEATEAADEVDAYINGQTTAPTSKTFAGYTFDSANALNSTGGETVYANGKTEIKLYYENNRVSQVTKVGNVYTMHGDNNNDSAYYYTTATAATTAYYSVKISAPKYFLTYYGDLNAGITISQGVAKDDAVGEYKSIQIGPSQKGLCVFNNAIGSMWRNLATYNDPWTSVTDETVGIIDGKVTERTFTVYVNKDMLMMFVDGNYINHISLTDTTCFKADFVAGQPYIFGVQCTKGKHSVMPVTIEVLGEAYGEEAMKYFHEFEGAGGVNYKTKLDTTKSSKTIVYSVAVVATKSTGLPHFANAMGHAGVAIAPASDTSKATTMGYSHYGLNLSPNSRCLDTDNKWDNTVRTTYAFVSAHGLAGTLRGGNFTIVIYNDMLYIYAGARTQTFIRSIPLAAGNGYIADAYVVKGGEYCVGYGLWAIGDGVNTTDLQNMGLYAMERTRLYGDDALAELASNSLYSNIGVTA